MTGSRRERKAKSARAGTDACEVGQATQEGLCSGRTRREVGQRNGCKDSAQGSLAPDEETIIPFLLLLAGLRGVAQPIFLLGAKHGDKF